MVGFSRPAPNKFWIHNLQFMRELIRLKTLDNQLCNCDYDFWNFNMMSLFRAIVLINLMTVFVTSEFTAVVNTTHGPVRGKILKTVLSSMEYSSFRGIRYAKAPIGYQRFQPPIPPDPWTEIFNATSEGEYCIQMYTNTTTQVVGSEDCLNLNVFTPVTDLENPPKKLKAVMVWFYGGAWLTGASSTEMFGPDYLVERDIVFVSCNYRGGAFGFLSLDHPNATGNAGLKDQLLVLKWVQANIKEFGGNPDNVTISGGSSGSVSVGYHILSDASVGLFHGTISMSGTPLIPWGFQTTRQALFHARTLGRMLGLTSGSKTVLLKTLYEASAAEIAIASMPIGRIVSFIPTLENASIATDVFISKCSILKYFTGNFTKVPQIIGFMEEETVTFTYCRKKEMGPYLETIDYVMDLVKYLGMDMPKCLPLVFETFDSWNSEPPGEFETSIIQDTVKQMSDFLYISQIDLTQRIFAAYNDNKPVYYYHITFDMWRSPHNVLRNCSIAGPGHGDDLAYIFYARNGNWTLDPESPMGITIYRVVTLLTNFVKYGNPTPHWVDEHPLNVTWPDSGPKGLSLEIGNDLKVGLRPINENQKLIQSYYWVKLPEIHGCL